MVFSNCENIPDTKTIKGSQQLYHIQGSSTNTGKEMQLISSLLPCLCDKCVSTNNENTDACVYRHLRGITTHTVERIIEGEGGDEGDDDENSFGMKDLSVDELKDHLKDHGLSTTGNKKELYERIIDDLENQEDNPEYEEQEADRVEVGSESKSESSESENESESD